VILRAMFSRQWLLTTLLALAGGALCIRLGIWQLDRLEQRRAFNEHVEAMWAAEPLSLAGEPAEDLTTMEYRAVTLSGTYDFENQVVLRNRYFQNEYGYNLLTPLLLDDGSAVLVDRGWIPADGNDLPGAWRRYDQPGRVNVQGQIRLGQARPDMGGVSDPALAPGQSKLEFWNNVNLERIGQQLPYPLVDVYVQPEVDPADATPPIPYQPELELSEGPHLGYAVQWFTFASILVLGYPFYVRKELLKPSEGSGPSTPPQDMPSQGYLEEI
jgi:surfeit locus 1 family protein